MSLKGKTAVITGGTNGIGLATARNYLKEGVINVVLLDICENKENVQKLQAEFEHANIVVMLTDITKRDTIEQTFEKILNRFQQIDIVVTSAGVLREKNLEETINVNLIGTINTSLVAMKAMSKENGKNGGTIVNISSVAGLIAAPRIPFYCASKHGIIGFSRSMAGEEHYSKHGINFIVICPAFTDTTLGETGMKLDGMPVEEIDAMKKWKALERRQTADQCGKNIAIITAGARNGVVWILETGKIEEVSIPEYWRRSQ